MDSQSEANETNKDAQSCLSSAGTKSAPESPSAHGSRSASGSQSAASSVTEESVTSSGEGEGFWEGSDSPTISNASDFSFDSATAPESWPADDDKKRDAEEAPEEEVVGHLEVLTAIINTVLHAVDVAAKCVDSCQVGLHGAGDTNPANILKQRVLDQHETVTEMSATFVVLGPPKCGKTTLTHALVGYPLLPTDVPSRVTTKWTHIVGRTTPRLRISDPLYELLREWVHVVMPDLPVQALPQEVELFDKVSTVLMLCQKIVSVGRRKELITETELVPLCDISHFVEVELEFASLSVEEENDVQTGLLSILDLPSPQPFSEGDYNGLYSHALTQCQGVFLVTDAARTCPMNDMTTLITDLIGSNALSSEDVWVIGNCYDKLPGFYCTNGVETVGHQVKRDLYAKFGNIVLDEERIIPTAAHLSLLAVYGLKNMYDLVGEKKVLALGKKLVDNAQQEAWFSDIAHFAYGINWQRSVKQLTLPRWETVLQNMQNHGQVTKKLSHEILTSAYQAIVPKCISKCVLALGNHIHQFNNALEILEGKDFYSLNSGEMERVFGLFFNDMNVKVVDVLNNCLPTQDDVDSFMQSLPLMSFDVCQQGFDSQKGIVLEENKEGVVVEGFIKQIGRALICRWREKFMASMRENTILIKRGREKWERTFEHILLELKVDASTRRQLLDFVAQIQDVPTHEVTPFDENDLETSCAAFGQELPVKKQKARLARTRKFFTVTPGSVRKFIGELRFIWAKKAHELTSKLILAPVSNNFDGLCDIVDKMCESGTFSKYPQRREFDFTFAHKLKQVLPRLADIYFDPMNPSSEEMQEVADACELVEATVQQISRRYGIA